MFVEMMASSGGAQVDSGIVTLSDSATTRVDLGFTPKCLAIFTTGTTRSSCISGVWTSDAITTTTSGFYFENTMSNTGASVSGAKRTINSSNTNRGGFVAVDSTGFTLSNTNTGYNQECHWFAIG